ncbi:hypothetical protein HELRODRAFT_113809 [Helobdella robusta]|uniref:USP domain-containing protein n=1 Tax=Helobdella robusta TaxID=6412 RepID=T1EFW9_HELRO|nr:hypothetical protein HELRODRAFT_113809 [Helobdella robusta]ESN98487.1 hypothetical protein HELRODRAFT_113809 [Helobdella robusta]
MTTDKCSTDDVFKGYTLSTFVCLKCFEGCHLVEKFMDLCLPITFKKGEELNCSCDELMKVFYNSNNNDDVINNNNNNSNKVMDDYTKSLIRVVKMNSSNNGRSEKSTRSLDVTDCLKFYTKIYYMEENLCRNCERSNPYFDVNSLPPAIYRQMICHLPPVLVMHLKRFKQNFSGRFEKSCVNVKYPPVLDMAAYCCDYLQEFTQQQADNDNASSSDKSTTSTLTSSATSSRSDNFGPKPFLYNLYGVVEHAGSLCSGHFVAYVKNNNNKKNNNKKNNNNKNNNNNNDDGNYRWFYISDTWVKPTSEEDALSSQAYLLFYEKIC